jgi:hypothetical protein
LRAQRPALANRFIAGHENAEYLYGILHTSDFNDAPGTDLFGNSAFADQDKDGYLEVVDAWGEPLEFEIKQVAVIDDPPPIPLNWKDDTSADPVDLSTWIPRDLQKIQFVVRSVNLE